MFLASVKRLGAWLKGAPASGSPFYPGLDAMVVEASFACNLSFRMCPRSHTEVKSAFLPQETFERSAAHFQRFKWIILTGYGEPLLHPNLPVLLRRIRKEGRRSYFATNGTLFTGKRLEAVLAERPAEINFSIDAARKETYEAIRQKGSFDQLMGNFGELKAYCEKRHYDATLFHWVFVMMKGNVAELAAAVKLAGEHGFKRFTAKHMESALSKEDFQDALFNTGIAPDLTAEEDAAFKARVDEARSAAAPYGIEFLLHPRRHIVDGTCLAGPLSMIFVDCKGNVSPCCYLTAYSLMPYNDHKPQWNGVIGNLNDTPLEEILHDPRYLEFRRQWSESQPPDCCTGCVQLQRMRIAQDY